MLFFLLQCGCFAGWIYFQIIRGWKGSWSDAAAAPLSGDDDSGALRKMPAGADVLHHGDMAALTALLRQHISKRGASTSIKTQFMISALLPPFSLPPPPRLPFCDTACESVHLWEAIIDMLFRRASEMTCVAAALSFSDSVHKLFLLLFLKKICCSI